MPKRRRKWPSVIGNLSIQTKFILTIISLVFCAASFLTVYFYNSTSRLIIENSKRYITNVMQQTGKNLDNSTKDIEDVLFDISTDRPLQTLLNYANRAENDSYERIRLGVEIKNMLISQIIKIDSISAVFFHLLEESVFASKSGDFPDPDISLLSGRILEGKGSTVWLGSNMEHGYVIVGKAVYGLSHQKLIGQLVMYVDISYFTRIFDAIELTGEDNIFILDEAGILVAGDGAHLSEKVLPLQDPRRFQLYNAVIDGDEKQIASVPLLQRGWRLLSVSENELANRELHRLQQMTAILFGSILVISSALGVFLARSISSPIRKLTQSMEQFSKGDFSVQASVKYNDEIGQLRATFNTMVGDIDRLLHRVVEEQTLKQQAQISALQMQINPHFLYNTLDTINWLASTYEADSIAEVSRSLACLMRFSLKEEDFISVEEELDAVEHYMCIQKHRYGAELSLELQIQEEVLYEKMPPHIILPLIENAVEHGFADVIHHKEVFITGKMLEGRVEIELRDNGVGIPSEKLELLLDENRELIAKQQGHISIGIRNVNKRLKLCFGEDYGLRIESVVGQGTVIRILLPAQEQLDLGEYNEL